MDAKVVWNGKMSFTGSADTGFPIALDASAVGGGENNGLRPLELLAIGLAGCTAMDVISILKKKRQEVTAFEVRAHLERTTEDPKVFTHIVMEYIVSGCRVELAAVERAVQLSAEKYCSAQAMLAKTAEIESKITIIEVDETSHKITIQI